MKKLKKLFPFIIIAASIIVVVCIAFSNKELENAWDVLFTLNPLWLILALVAWFAYVFFDGMTYYAFLKNQGYKIKITEAIYLSIIGYYYSDITPGATGGQPMQVYEMKKKDIPVGIGTSTITVRFIMNQFATCVIVVLLWAFNKGFVDEQLGSIQGFYIAGFLVNFIVIPVVLLAVIFPKWLVKVCEGIIKLGAKIKLIKDKESAKESVNKVIVSYRESFKNLLKQPKQLVLQFIISILCMLGLFFVTYFVYRAFGLSEVSWYRILAITVLLFVSASYTPLPGASGANEGGFMVYFAGIFPDKTIGLALLVWRFITFYLFLIIGPIVTLVSQIRLSRKQRLEEGGKVKTKDVLKEHVKFSNRMDEIENIKQEIEEEKENN